MPYRLKRRESTPKGVRRIAREQIDRALAELGEETPASGVAIHQARKRFKKLRALLRMLKPCLETRVYKAQNRRLRAMGHALAGKRDADVMLQTLDGLQQTLRDSGHDPEFTGLREMLRARRAAHGHKGSGMTEPPERAVAAELAGLRKQVGHWSFQGDGFDLAGPGFRRIYKRGRKAMRQARKHPGDRQFHDWRKRVKDHWYHCRLLKYLWPAPMRTRAGELKRLSDLLGDDHDLAVFRQTLHKLPDSKLPSSEDAMLQSAITERQHALRASALQLGLRVFAEKPGAIQKRFGRYARAARSS